ncbi:MAG: Hypothetical protein BHV28_03490 [Candidatus Tokpelaia hoelldobleri]|uniref:TIGR02300 family protein n=1 Tax=Candidatus Tokpelaia hoelldobleri TaxID=1902579 RepID=A0A1U9JT81_9HYPH|nr:MAG: Hypothetical protein BHV28_03490 [Candidatus Tokpelaia hoelldoblerii]
MAKAELGTKRIDPETGKKFYDLNRDPIVSPYTGISYPRSYFEMPSEHHEEPEESDDGQDLTLEKPDFVSLDDVDEEGKDDLPDLGDDDDDVDLGDDDDAFLPDDDDEDDDVSGIISGGRNPDDDS